MVSGQTSRIGVKRKFKVLDIRKDYNRWYYVIDVDGKEHTVKMFDFQKEKDSRPEEIDCLVKGLDENGSTIITQDLVPLIAERYKVDCVYDLKVKSPSSIEGEYCVLTPEGFIFHLVKPRDVTLREHQEVRCRITQISGIKVFVKLDKQGDPTGDMITPEGVWEVAESIGLPSALNRWARLSVHKDRLFESVRKSIADKSPDWVVDMVVVARNSISQWLIKSFKQEHRANVLDGMRRMCIYLLERSSAFGKKIGDRANVRTQLAETIKTVDIYIEAIGKIGDGSDDGYISDVKTGLQQTGYIYEPERRLRVLMAILNMKRDKLRVVMDDIFRILFRGRFEDWSQEPIRSAVVSMLEDYVRIAQSDVNHIIDISLRDNKYVATQMMHALAMMLLLTNDGDDINRHLYLARLCRCASLFSSNMSANLNEKAYSSLFGRVPRKLPFSWADLGLGSDIFSFKVAQVATDSTVRDMAFWEGQKAMISVFRDTITLSPLRVGLSPHNALPGWVLPWRNVRILVNDSVYEHNVNIQTRDTKDFRRMWRSIGDNLFSTGMSSVRAVQPIASKKRPKLDEEVRIRVTGFEDRQPGKGGNPYFHCVIDDKEFYGEGYLTPLDIVHYNLPFAKPSDFCDRDGHPYIFSAYVEDIDDDGKYHFAARDYIGEHIEQTISLGDQLRCLMTRMLPNGDQLLISEYGFSLRIPANDGAPMMKCGEQAFVEVTDVMPNGDVDATFIEMTETDPEMTDLRCFDILMERYADGSIYVPFDQMQDEEDDEDVVGTYADDESRQGQTEMEPEEVGELMNILDRQSVISPDRVAQYNYLGLVHLMADAIGDNTKAEECMERMQFIDIMQQYAINQKIEYTEYEKHYSDSAEVLAAYPDLRDKAMQIFAVGMIGKMSANDKLLQQATENAGTLTGDLAMLVLAYNMVERQKLDSSLKEIRDKINDKLKVVTRETTKFEHMGEEGQRLEFKTSIVFPPNNNMMANKNKQTLDVLKRVCGMMNAEGGKLLVGVNDMGDATGLEADFHHFAGYAEYDEQNCRDKMRNFFSFTATNHMPREASNYMSVDFEKHAGKTVMVVTIAKADRLITVDAIPYKRYDTVTRAMSESEQKHAREAMGKR